MRKVSEPERTYRTFPCEDCGAGPGQRCRRPSGRLIWRSHLSRKEQACGVQPRPRPRPCEVLLADVDALLGLESPGRIAARLGLQPRSIARALQRAGRHSDARRFARVLH